MWCFWVTTLTANGEQSTARQRATNMRKRNKKIIIISICKKFHRGIVHSYTMGQKLEEKKNDGDDDGDDETRTNWQWNYKRNKVRCSFNLSLSLSANMLSMWSLRVHSTLSCAACTIYILESVYLIPLFCWFTYFTLLQKCETDLRTHIHQTYPALKISEQSCGRT